jgi:hypothetical protein
MSSQPRRFDPAASALSAIENASRIPIRREDLRVLLATGEGEPSHLRALFGDVDLHTLLRLAAALDVDDEALVRAYARARKNVAAANSELDEYAQPFGF